jgi:hypothetical protein
MSGGIAYVFDEDGTFKNRCNYETVALEPLDRRDLQEVEEMLKRHAVYTRSARAWKLLALWQETAGKFVKVMPRDYRRVLEALQAAEAKGLVGDDASCWRLGEQERRSAGERQLSVLRIRPLNSLFASIDKSEHDLIVSRAGAARR